MGVLSYALFAMLNILCSILTLLMLLLFTQVWHALRMESPYKATHVLGGEPDPAVPI